MSKRIVIGVTGPLRGGLFAWVMTAIAIIRASGRPVRLRPGCDVNIDGLDGLILGGGTDIAPENYGEELQTLKPVRNSRTITEMLVSVVIFAVRSLFSIKASHHLSDPDRDHLENELFQSALESGLPVLGICRGAQMINIATGGTLHQEISGFYTETPHVRTILPAKTVDIAEGSRLRSLLDIDSCRVNSLHEQAINRLGNEIVVSATDRNGIVQGIEHRNHPCIIGVQWHPEYLPQKKSQQRIFRGLVKEAEKVKSS